MSRSGQSIIIRATERQLEHEQDDRARYTGRLSAQWNIGSVPNGGYTLATALNCAQDFVKRRRGKENANLFLASASFHAKVSSETDYVVEVRMLKQGRATTNMEADLLQKSGRQGAMQLCIRVTILFADFASLRSDPMLDKFTLQPGTPFAPTFPFVLEPEDRSDLKPWYSGHETPVVQHDHRAVQNARKNEQLITAKYMYLPEEHVAAEDMERHNIAAISLYCDTTADMRTMLPGDIIQTEDDFKGLWFPTMSLNIEIRHPLPTFALQRVAAYARTMHMTQGQWTFLVEIWSHPKDAERLGLPDGVRSIVLAVSQQTALTFSMAVNKSKSSKM